MPSGYPPFRDERTLLAEVRDAGAIVAGRYTERDGSRILRDESAEVTLSGLTGEPPAPGDWIRGRLRGDRLSDVRILAPRRGAPPDPERLVAILRRRARLLDVTRELFRGEGFLEVETACRVVCPGLEPHLVAFEAGDRRLRTSPELHLKRLLAAGAERIVEFARAFRDEERGPRHVSEFLLIEWYRAFAALDRLEIDCERLVSACARAAGVERVTECVLTPPFDRTTVRSALRERTGLDLAALAARDDLARAVAGRGQPVSSDDDWDDCFHRVWTAEVEPWLGRSRPVFVHDYPASQAALARIRETDAGPVAERFELYVAGVEIANAFLELNDPAEQRRRHEEDRARRAALGGPVYPLDEPFLAALTAGMPPAAGIALGFDRLVSLILGVSLAEVAPFGVESVRTDPRFDSGGH